MKTPLLFCLLATLASAEPDLGEQLRDALYTEEVTRDPEAAASAYEKILAELDRQRPIASSALFRLAEVRRQQKKHDEAIALYQRLLREFPEREAEAKLAREHLAALGGKAPTLEGTKDNPLEKEIRKYREMAKHSPDIFHGGPGSSGALYQVVSGGNLKLIEAVIDLGADPFSRDVLPLAVGNGLLEVCKLLLERGGMPNETEAAKAIENACHDSQLNILRLLLEHGLDANSRIPVNQNQFKLPIHLAIENQSLKAASLLLEHGAKVDSTCDVCPYREWIVATPLLAAAAKDDLDGVRFLLDRDADPNAKSRDGELTALLFAAGSGQAEPSIEIMKVLLASGADPNHRSADGPKIEGRNKDFYEGKTALDVARMLRNLDKIELLLEAGAKITPDDLKSSLSDKNQELFGLYLKHLPKFEADDPVASEILREAAIKGKDILPLIEHGARPTKDWIESGFNRADRQKAIPVLNKEFLFPRIADSESILLVKTAWANSNQTISSLASRSNESPPPPLARVLLDADLEFHYFNDREMQVEWRRWRKNDDGTMFAIEFNLAKDVPLPDLQWGDIVELRTVGQRPTPVDKRIGSIGFRNKLQRSPSTYWNLRRRVSDPIKFSIGETTRDLTLRGDLLVFDPTKDEVPLVSVRELVELLKPPSYFGPTTLTIRRQGMQDVILEYPDSKRPSWPSYDLEANDHLILETPAGTEDQRLALRRSRVAVEVPGVDAPVFIAPVPQPEFAPTLVEVLAAVYAPWGGIFPDGLPCESAEDLGKIAGLRTATILPHPDFSRLRIQRIDANGRETELPIDLAAISANCTAETGPEAARSSDVLLQAGDIIVLPLLSESEPWTGFTADQIRYFDKVLDGAVQVTDRDGDVSMREINWKPVHWTPSPGGLIPIPPKEASTATRARDLGLGSSYMFLTRNGRNLGQIGYEVILRNGDRIEYIQPAARPATRGPAPRAVDPQR